ncbi:uncharacterized protein MONBRDRAFT_6442 [Monosiga brevicollis MX1]|uniref:PDZ domain-containing protein n=1 Tax=Monosiga brevicollis TaxID=81824 RepID=A9UTW0_MONBE|nr:uncharacterized protein MONBRDRAFT_6442 [Monosiga brevicollis MX1]EDQ91562.1 predicted protein [Monosiga brevicollis MX1]|eukprot:XP_001743984.1 hypothetical protein [Monosiga brevicollis MX1]
MAAPPFPGVRPRARRAVTAAGDSVDPALDSRPPFVTEPSASHTQGWPATAVASATTFVKAPPASHNAAATPHRASWLHRRLDRHHHHHHHDAFSHRPSSRSSASPPILAPASVIRMHPSSHPVNPTTVRIHRYRSDRDSDSDSDLERGATSTSHPAADRCASSSTSVSSCLPPSRSAAGRRRRKVRASASHSPGAHNRSSPPQVEDWCQSHDKTHHNHGVSVANQLPRPTVTLQPAAVSPIPGREPAAPATAPLQPRASRRCGLDAHHCTASPSLPAACKPSVDSAPLPSPPTMANRDAIYDSHNALPRPQSAAAPLGPGAIMAHRDGTSVSPPSSARLSRRCSSKAGLGAIAETGRARSAFVSGSRRTSTASLEVSLHHICLRRNHKRFGLGVKTYGSGEETQHCLQIDPDVDLQLICGSHQPHNGDVLVTLNGENVEQLSHDVVVRMLKHSEHVLHLTVRPASSTALPPNGPRAISRRASAVLLESVSSPTLLPVVATPTSGSPPSTPSTASHAALLNPDTRSHPAPSNSETTRRESLSNSGTPPLPESRRPVREAVFSVATTGAGAAIFRMRGAQLPDTLSARLQHLLKQVNVLRTCASRYHAMRRVHEFYLTRDFQHPLFLLAFVRFVQCLALEGLSPIVPMNIQSAFARNPTPLDAGFVPPVSILKQPRPAAARYVS